MSDGINLHARAIAGECRYEDPILGNCSSVKDFISLEDD
jgi:hypothetical protein